jgi:hypothetical protein
MPLITQPTQPTPAPTDASVIKSIQRGSTSLASDGNTNVTINSVNTSKSFVSVSCKSGGKCWRVTSDDGYYHGSSGALVAGASLTSSTNLNIRCGNLNGYSQILFDINATAYWEVVEYV